MTQTALAKTDIQSLAAEFEYKESFVQTVKDTFAKNATNDELRLFLQTAKRTGLDPFARQIYCIKRWDAAAGKEVMSVQVSIDGFRAIADRTGRYVPSKEPTFTFDAKGNLESATAYIKKYVGGVWHEISATAFYSEYVQTKKDKTPTAMWLKMPRLMLAKCAESLVLRKAFPAELSGLYTPDEMGSELQTGAIVEGVQQTAFEVYTEDQTGQTIDAEPLLPDHPAEAAESLYLQLDELYKLENNPNREKALANFAKLQTLTEKENVLAEVRQRVETALREKVKAAVGSDGWPYTPDKTVEYLASFGIDAIDKAEIPALKKAVEAFAEDGIL